MTTVSIRVAIAMMLWAGLWLAPPAGAQEHRGDWELTFSGAGASDRKLSQNEVGVRASVGYFLTDAFEVSFRQTASYVDVQGSSTSDFSSVMAADYDVPLGHDRRWVVYGGVNGGYFYGDAFSSRFEVAPEAGVKFFVNPTTFVFLQAEYQFYFSGSGGSNGSDRQFVYTLGLGIRL